SGDGLVLLPEMGTDGTMTGAKTLKFFAGNTPHGRLSCVSCNLFATVGQRPAICGRNRGRPVNLAGPDRMANSR
ncbi:MAG: hypothetical protein WAK98_08910, partial [Gemmobacter sp.]